MAHAGPAPEKYKNKGPIDNLINALKSHDLGKTIEYRNKVTHLGDAIKLPITIENQEYRNITPIMVAARCNFTDGVAELLKTEAANKEALATQDDQENTAAIYAIRHMGLSAHKFKLIALSDFFSEDKATNALALAMTTTAERCNHKEKQTKLLQALDCFVNAFYHKESQRKQQSVIAFAKIGGLCRSDDHSFSSVFSRYLLALPVPLHTNSSTTLCSLLASESASLTDEDDKKKVDDYINYIITPTLQRMSADYEAVAFSVKQADSYLSSITDHPGRSRTGSAESGGGACAQTMTQSIHVRADRDDSGPVL